MASSLTIISMRMPYAIGMAIGSANTSCTATPSALLERADRRGIRGLWSDHREEGICKTRGGFQARRTASDFLGWHGFLRVCVSLPGKRARK